MIPTKVFFNSDPFTKTEIEVRVVPYSKLVNVLNSNLPRRGGTENSKIMKKDTTGILGLADLKRKIIYLKKYFCREEDMLHNLYHELGHLVLYEILGNQRHVIGDEEMIVEKLGNCLRTIRFEY